MRRHAVTLALSTMLAAMPASATTVLPPENLGEMVHVSDATVFAEAESVRVETSPKGLILTLTRFRTVESVAGTAPGDTFEVRVLGGTTEERGLSVPGAPRFEPGERYLLFLHRGGRGWQPRMMAYGLLRENVANGLLEPLEAVRAIELLSPTGTSYEPVGAYRRDALLRHLAEVGRGTPWDASRAREGLVVRWGEPQSVHNAPEACVYFDGDAGDPIRWFGFESGVSTSIFYTTPGQAGISDGGRSAVQEGIAAWTLQPDSAIRYEYDGSRENQVGNCDNPEYFGNVTFNDPCDVIPPLDGCSGTAGVAGAFFTADTTPYGGEEFHKIVENSVIVNEGAACLGETTFKLMVTHELGHTLGFDHHDDPDATMFHTFSPCCHPGRGAAIAPIDRACSSPVYSFFDVSYDSLFWPFIEGVRHAGVTTGCGNGDYCPGASVTRAQMAAFVLLALEGDGYTPPPCTSAPFDDVAAGDLFCPWIQELAVREIASGCGGGNYCPSATVTRAQMAKFLLAARDGNTPPPDCTEPPFADVPETSLFCPWIDKLVDDGITTGCGDGNYCPGDAISRAQMAPFLTRTFTLPTP